MRNKLKLVLLWLFFMNLALAAVNKDAKKADVRLYALDCGSINIHNGADFSDTGFYSHKPIILADPCFLIKHNNDWLIWDLGLGDQYVGRTVNNSKYGVSLSVSVSLVDQLKKLNLALQDIKYVSLSHFHFDHTGNASLFPHATWVLQKAEYKSLEPKALPMGVGENLAKILLPVLKIAINGDYDLFSDGSVVMLRTPGHTVGHQSLQLKLPHTGTVILSGDLYHIREARKFKQIPVYNFSRADTLASMARIEEILQNTHGRLVIQHDPDDFAALPKFPKFLN